MWRIRTTPHFDRRVRRFLKLHPELRSALGRLIDTLSKNPFDVRCKTHQLTGPLRGYHAASIDYRYRLVFLIDGDILVLINIGSHDEVY